MEVAARSGIIYFEEGWIADMVTGRGYKTLLRSCPRAQYFSRAQIRFARDFVAPKIGKKPREVRVALAPLLVQAMFETVRKISESGLTVLLVEQQIHKALQLAHVAFLLENGRTVLSGPTSNLVQNDDVKRVYLGMEGREERGPAELSAESPDDVEHTDFLPSESSLLKPPGRGGATLCPEGTLGWDFPPRRLTHGTRKGLSIDSSHLCNPFVPSVFPILNGWAGGGLHSRPSLCPRVPFR